MQFTTHYKIVTKEKSEQNRGTIESGYYYYFFYTKRNIYYVCTDPVVNETKLIEIITRTLCF